MSALVIAEHDNHSIKPSTLNTVAAAAKTSNSVTVYVIGSNCSGAATAAAAIAGIAKVLVADAIQFADQLAENVTAQVLATASGFTHILLPATRILKFH